MVLLIVQLEAAVAVCALFERLEPITRVQAAIFSSPLALAQTSVSAAYAAETCVSTSSAKPINVDRYMVDFLPRSASSSGRCLRTSPHSGQIAAEPIYGE